MYDHKTIAALRKSVPEQMAQDIISTQPMPNDFFKPLLENSMPKNELIAEGYEPRSHVGLMWVKK